MEEPFGLPSMGSHRVGHDCGDLAAACVIVGECNGTPLQYSCLENPMDRGAWKAAVQGVAEGRTRLREFTFSLPLYLYMVIYDPLSEKAMAPHSSTLAWKIPWTEEPGRLQSMGSLRELDTNE